MKKTSLKIRLLSLFLCLFIIVVLMISGVSRYLLTSTVKKQTAAHTRQMLEQFERSVQQDISEYFAMAVLMDQDVKLQRLLRKFYQNEGSYQTRIELRESLSPYLKQKEYIVSILFFFRDGTMYYDSIPPEYTPEEIQTMNWYKEIKDTKERFRLLSREDRIPFRVYSDYMFSMVYHSADTSYDSGIEVVYFAFANGTFERVYQEHMWEQAGQLFILNEDGYVIGGRGSVTDETLFKESWDKGEMKEPGGQFRMGGKEVMYCHSQMTGWTLAHVTEYGELNGDIKKVSATIILLFIIAGFLLCTAAYYMIHRVAEPLEQLTVRMKDFCELLDTDVVIRHVSDRDECEQLERIFEQMAEDIKRLVAQVECTEKERAKAEISALQYQIRPHFMLNTLNAIRSLAIVTGADPKVQQMMRSFACVIDGCLTDITSCHSLSEEKRYLTNYLMLMELRYGESWDAIIDFPEELMHSSIMKYLVQPLVENSILHGFRSMNVGGCIRISAVKEDRILCIIVEDNGQGIPKEKLECLLEETGKETEETRIGIQNVRRRIRLNYPDNAYGIDIGILDKGTEIVLRLPLENHTDKRGR